MKADVANQALFRAEQHRRRFRLIAAVALDERLCLCLAERPFRDIGHDRRVRRVGVDSLPISGCERTDSEAVGVQRGKLHETSSHAWTTARPSQGQCLTDGVCEKSDPNGLKGHMSSALRSSCM